MVEPEIVEKCTTFFEEGYLEPVKSFIANGNGRFTVSFRDLYRYDPNLADDLIDAPDQVIEGLGHGLANAEFPPKIQGVFERDVDPSKVTIAVNDFGNETTPVGRLRHSHVGTYVALTIQVDMRTQVQPQSDSIAFECECGHITYVDQFGENITEPGKCESCERNGPFTINDQRTVYRDHQLIDVSDPPEVSTGRSDSLTVEAYDDLTGVVEAGDRANVTGVLETKSVADERSPSRRRPLRLTAQTIETEKTGFDELSTDRIDEIKALSEEPGLYQRLVDSIAPHIMADERGEAIKLALALQLFGGVERELETGYKRGNINVLLIGTPGTAKSQYLRAVNRIAPKSIYVSGKNARPAGMTATAVQSEHTGEWTLKAGALVKASGGIACVDEFDKMQRETKSSLHEALEDQSISVAKADINTTLPAKTSVLGAANPKGGMFDRFTALSEQIDIGPTILSRFDLIFGLQDHVDEEWDRKTARHQHDAGDPDVSDPDPAIDLDLLTEYVAYARQNVFPSYADDSVRDDLVEYYVEMRQESLEQTDKDSQDDQIRPVSPRVNELLRRLAQASARARLDGEITHEDTARIKDLFKRTIGEVGLDEDGNVDGNKLDGYSEKELSQQQRIRGILEIIRSHSGPDEGAKKEVVIAKATEQGMEKSTAESEFEKLHRQGEIYEPETGYFRVSP